MPNLKKTSIALLGLFVLMAIGEWFNVFSPLDRWFYNLAVPISSDGLDKMVDYIAALGGTTVVGAAVLALLVVAWRNSEMRTLVAIGVVVLVVGELIEIVCKTVIAHPGPQARVMDVASLPFEGNGSFPSGHTLRVTVVSSIAAMLLTQRWPGRNKLWWILAILVTGVVSAARIYLGDHWFSDVVGSWLLGVGLLCVAIQVAPRIKSRFKL